MVHDEESQNRLKEYGKKDIDKESDYCIYHHRPGVPAGGRYHLVCVEMRPSLSPCLGGRLTSDFCLQPSHIIKGTGDVRKDVRWLMYEGRWTDDWRILLVGLW